MISLFYTLNYYCIDQICSFYWYLLALNHCKSSKDNSKHNQRNYVKYINIMSICSKNINQVGSYLFTCSSWKIYAKLDYSLLFLRLLCKNLTKEKALDSIEYCTEYQFKLFFINNLYKALLVKWQRGVLFACKSPEFLFYREILCIFAETHWNWSCVTATKIGVLI